MCGCTVGRTLLRELSLHTRLQSHLFPTHSAQRTPSTGRLSQNLLVGTDRHCRQCRVRRPHVHGTCSGLPTAAPERAHGRGRHAGSGGPSEKQGGRPTGSPPVAALILRGWSVRWLVGAVVWGLRRTMELPHRGTDGYVFCLAFRRKVPKAVPPAPGGALGGLIHRDRPPARGARGARRLRPGRGGRVTSSVQLQSSCARAQRAGGGDMRGATQASLPGSHR